MLRSILIAWNLVSATFAAQTVVGNVINVVTGTGVGGVHVQLFPAGNSSAVDGYSATTDSEGRFRIEGVEEGAYRARYTAPGFSPVPDSGGILPPFAVAQGSEPVRLVGVKMQPMAKLSGRVVDASGKSVPNAVVWLIRGKRWCNPPACFLEHRALTTDEKGEYVISNIVPGSWLLCAAAPPTWIPPEPRGGERFGWEQTYYPGVIEPQLAEALTVRGGEQSAPSIKLAAAPVHRIHGRILDERGDPLSKAFVTIGQSAGPSLTQKANDDGSFEFSAVVEGEMRLSATGERDGVQLKVAQSLDIKDHDLENVELRLTAPFSLRGKVVMKAPEGAVTPPVPPTDLVLVSGTALLSDGADALVPIRLDDGDLTAETVYPGIYEIRPLSESPVPYYLDSVRLGDQGTLGVVAILSGAQPLTITYRLGGGTVRGNVKDCGTARVILIPQDDSLRRGGFVRVTDCGLDGQFEFAAVRPGNYFGLAAEGAPGSFVAIFQDDDLLKKASSVAVHANESTTAEIRLIAR